MVARKSAAVLCLVTGGSGRQLPQPSEPEKGEFPPPKVRELGKYHRLEDAFGSKSQDPHPPPLPPYRYFSPFGYARSLEFRTAALTLRSPQTNHNGSN